MLPQYGFSGFAVLDIEQNAVPERAQEIRRLKERLDRELVGILTLLLPPRHEPARRVPGHAVPVIDQMRLKS
jgi:hypothetical protein